MISAWSMEGIGNTYTYRAIPGELTWPSANLAMGYPFSVAESYPVASLWYCTAGTVGGNSVDLGIYDAAGNRLISSGSFVPAGAQTIQSRAASLTLAATTRYYFLMSCNGTANGYQAINFADATVADLCGVVNVAGAFPLPATVTFAVPTQAPCPLAGFGDF